MTRGPIVPAEHLEIPPSDSVMALRNLNTSKEYYPRKGEGGDTLSEGDTGLRPWPWSGSQNLLENSTKQDTLQD